VDTIHRRMFSAQDIESIMVPDSITDRSTTNFIAENLSDTDHTFSGYLADLV
jgi:hypothetical protein